MAYQAPSLDATANTTVSVVLWCILICWSGLKAPWLLPVSTIFRTLFYGINSSLTTSVFQKTMNIRPFLLLLGSPKASVVALSDMSWTALQLISSVWKAESARLSRSIRVQAAGSKLHFPTRTMVYAMLFWWTNQCRTT